MKILLLDTRPVRRGAQVFLQELKKQFVTSGVTIYRIFLYKESYFECLHMENTDCVLDFKDNHWMEKYIFFQPTLLMQLSKNIKLFNPDVILCNGSRTLKYAALVKRFNPELKAKWVYRVIDSAQYWNRNPMVVWTYKKFIISAMDAAVGVSNKSLQEMKAHYQFKKPTIAIPRAIDIPHFSNFVPDPNLRKSWGIGEQAFVVLFLGNFTRQKRPDRFVEVIRTVREKYPQVHGLMVGDGPLKSETVGLIKQAGLDVNFTLSGYQQDVRPFISMSDLLMLTSDTEGMPGVVLEAASMSKTTIASDVGGVREFLSHGENGLIVHKEIVNQFAENLIQLIENFSMSSKLGENAFIKVSSGFSVNDIAQRYLKFFQEL